MKFCWRTSKSKQPDARGGVCKGFRQKQETIQIKIGFMPQSVFGKKIENGESIWLIKDLNVGQLYELIQTMSKKGKHLIHCCNAPLRSAAIAT